MSQQPRWKRRWRNWLFNRPGYPTSPVKKLVGWILCLLGLGIVLAATPGWLYLISLGAGMTFLGIMMLQ